MSTEPIFDPLFWRERLARAIDREQVHHAVFDAPREKWKAINVKHHEILSNTIQPTDSIFDAGCGWGRLLSVIPDWWIGNYLGIDISPDFVEIARRTHPSDPSTGKARLFLCGDLRYLDRELDRFPPLPQWAIYKKFDWAVLISIRPMIIKNAGQGVWDGIEKQLRRYCKQLLFLEYNELDKGVIE